MYNRFVSMMTQSPESVRLLPLEITEADDSEAGNAVYPLYEFEPDAETVLDAILPCTSRAVSSTLSCSRLLPSRPRRRRR